MIATKSGVSLEGQCKGVFEVPSLGAAVRDGQHGTQITSLGLAALLVGVESVLLLLLVVLVVGGMDVNNPQMINWDFLPIILLCLIQA